MIIGHIGGGGESTIDTGDIQKSLRFAASRSTYLSRTFGAPTDNRKWSFSCCTRRGALGQSGAVLSAYYGDPNFTYIRFSSADKLEFYTVETGGIDYSRESVAAFRDPTAHLHILVVYDSANATAADRIILYVNSVRLATTDTYGTIPQNVGSYINTALVTNIGRNQDSGACLDGYLSRVCVVDGQALTPSAFGYFNTEINEWVSKSRSAVRAAVLAGGGVRNGWGANGSMQDFDNGTSLTTLGYDISQADDGTGGNHWTLNNHSLTAGVNYDWMDDVPGNSFATFNPLIRPYPGTEPITDGNLKLSCTNAGVSGSGWVTVPFSTGRYKFEGVVTAVGGGVFIGVSNNIPVAGLGTYTNSANQSGYFYSSNGSKYLNGTGSAYGATYTTGDKVAVCVDADAGAIEFFKNGTSQGVAFTGISNTGGYLFAVQGINGAVWDVTAGQRPFGYDYGSFKALNQRNLPAVPAALLDPTDHHIDITVTKSGDTNFTLPWDASTYDTFFEIKRRDASGDWYQIDGLRGYDKILKSNGTAAETTDANVLGVSGTTCTLKSTLANGTYIISATKAGLSASRQTNTDGSITSTVSRNVDSGFAIVTYTGTGVGTQTVGHGLGVTPAMIAVKDRDVNSNANDWFVRHRSLAANNNLVLNGTGAATNIVSGSLGGGIGSSPTSTVFQLTNGTTDNRNVNELNDKYVAYCYADSAIQKSFSYTGNGSADGPYVNLGFECGRIIFKGSTAVSSWIMLDTARGSSNVIGPYLFAESSVAEGTTTLVDVTSNGLKVRATGTDLNASGQTIVCHAWAATTGKYSNAR